ncbi:hypothetical protein AAL_06558 [Moelleriella libera RCEF 2490]|uniref:Uncharacterized protein n=1 Tax=Moelleriella libera RCEF 2490 TaxID=1081109 RepID=A0A167YVA2_9HYPO|nr:hypothetical protein AAL_06558 [Moelleriella libera RCEF 2490]
MATLVHSAPADDLLPPRKNYRRRVLKPCQRSLNRLVRANAKHLVRTGRVDGLPGCHDDHSQLDRASLEPHLQRDLFHHFSNVGRPQYRDHTPRAIDHQDEGRDLAYSDVQLPSDNFRLGRRPPFGREDAFRDASTSGGKVHVGRRLGLGAADDGYDEDQQVAALYQMGLLYDNEPDRDSFSLNSIQHSEPVYFVRPARSARSKPPKAGKRPHQDRPLHLELSFSDLGSDDAIAQCLAIQADAEQEEEEEAAMAWQQRGQAAPQPPLHVIYELDDGGPLPDQPPGLVDDVLSEYDCVPDAGLSQTEVQEGVDDPSADAWIVLGEDS